MVSIVQNPNIPSSPDAWSACPKMPYAIVIRCATTLSDIHLSFTGFKTAGSCNLQYLTMDQATISYVQKPQPNATPAEEI